VFFLSTFVPDIIHFEFHYFYELAIASQRLCEGLLKGAGVAPAPFLFGYGWSWNDGGKGAFFLPGGQHGKKGQWLRRRR
jgi:hypothetical protein